MEQNVRLSFRLAGEALVQLPLPAEGRAVAALARQLVEARLVLRNYGSRLSNNGTRLVEFEPVHQLAPPQQLGRILPDAGLRRLVHDALGAVRRAFRGPCQPIQVRERLPARGAVHARGGCDDKALRRSEGRLPRRRRRRVGHAPQLGRAARGDRLPLRRAGPRLARHGHVRADGAAAR